MTNIQVVLIKVPKFRSLTLHDVTPIYCAWLMEVNHSYIVPFPDPSQCALKGERSGNETKSMELRHIPTKIHK